MIFYANGSQDITTDIVLRDSVTHVEKTSVDVTTIDTYYHEQGAAISTKVDIAALSAATDAHEDGHGCEIGQGVYRIDWEDAAFDGGVGKRVTLIVKASGCDTVYLRVLLSPAVNVASIGGTAQTAGDIFAADGGLGDVHTVVNTISANQGTPTNTGGTATIAAILGDPSNVSVAANVALIVADTNELQTDWKNGGRLDLLLDAVSTGQGTGAVTWAYTVTDGTNPIPDVHVWVTSDVGGSNTIASGTTNSSGVVTFYLDAATYYFWSQKAGYDFTNPDAEAVA